MTKLEGGEIEKERKRDSVMGKRERKVGKKGREKKEERERRGERGVKECERERLSWRGRDREERSKT